MRKVLLLLIATWPLFLPAQNWEKICSASGVVTTLISYDNQLFVAGNFFDIDGENSTWFGQWDGTKMTYNEITYGGGGFWDMTVHQGELYGIGSIEGGVVKWSGGRWVSFDDVRQSGVAIYSDGQTLYYGTDFGKLRKYNQDEGFVTLPSPEGDEGISDLITYKGELIAAGSFSTLKGIAVLRNGEWESIGEGLNGRGINTLEIYDGYLYATGTLENMTDDTGKGLVKWDGKEWSDAAGGITGELSNGVRDLRVINDILYVAGNFDEVNKSKTSGVVKWDGKSWSDCLFQDTVGSFPNALGEFNGQVVVGMFDFNEANVYIDADPSGTTELEGPAISIYPQPTSSVINLSLGNIDPNHAQIEIFDMQGRKLINQSTTHTSFNVQSWHKGMYLLTVVSDNQERLIARRFLIE